MNQLDREAFVQALLTGELSLDHPQVQARLRAEPELLTMLDQMREMEAAVARAAGEQREVLEAARSSADTGLADRVTAGVRQVVVERQRSRRIKWLAAAAVLVAGLLLGWFLIVRTPTAPGDLWLGSHPGLKPQGVVKTFSPFSWEEQPPQVGRFEVRIYSISNGGKGRWLYTSPPVNITSPWTMPAEAEAALPDEIYWELLVVGDDLPEPLHALARRQR
jgi:hypothetical protein